MRAVCCGGLSVAVAGTSIKVRIFQEARMRCFVIFIFFIFIFILFRPQRRGGLPGVVS